MKRITPVGIILLLPPTLAANAAEVQGWREDQVKMYYANLCKATCAPPKPAGYPGARYYPPVFPFPFPPSGTVRPPGNIPAPTISNPVYPRPGTGPIYESCQRRGCQGEVARQFRDAIRQYARRNYATSDDHATCTDYNEYPILRVLAARGSTLNN
jgi:hypothetical protein